jgi:hypothetical protein
MGKIFIIMVLSKIGDELLVAYENILGGRVLQQFHKRARKIKSEFSLFDSKIG